MKKKISASPLKNKTNKQIKTVNSISICTTSDGWGRPPASSLQPQLRRYPQWKAGVTKDNFLIEDGLWRVEHAPVEDHIAKNIWMTQIGLNGRSGGVE